MNAPIWSDLETSAFETLVGRCATVALRKSDSRIGALLALMALSHARLDADVHDNHLEAELRVHPAPPAAELLDHIACVVSDVARCARGETRLDISARLDDWGYAFLMVDLLGDGAREAELTAMAECVGAALTRVHKRVEELCTQHLRAVLTRDAPQAAFLSRGLTLQAEWLLAPDLSGDASRPDILVRRAQALSLFGSLVSVLREPAITEVIDRGEPLTSALAGHLGLTEAELRAFRGARDIRTSIEQWDDFVVAARRQELFGPAPRMARRRPAGNTDRMAKCALVAATSYASDPPRLSRREGGGRAGRCSRTEGRSHSSDRRRPQAGCPLAQPCHRAICKRAPFSTRATGKRGLSRVSAWSTPGHYWRSQAQGV